MLAQGAQIHFEEASHIVANLPDGSQIAYTDAQGRDQDGAFPLVPGSAAATEMIAAIEARSRFGVLRLSPAIDALALAASFSAPAAEKKERSQAGAGGSREVAASPQQDGGLVLHWEKPPAHTSISRSWESTSVEVEYRFTGRDHLGRLEDTLRVTANPTDDVERPVLDLSQATTAQSAPLTPTDRDVLKAVLGQMDERLRPDLEAAASFLRLRSQAEYQRRIETAQGVAERARREQPDETRQTEQALKQEVGAISAVFAVEVEATVTAAWVIHSPMADIIYHLPGGATVEAALDLGRAAAEPLACVACQQLTREAAICAHAHILCPACRDLTPESCGLCTGAVSSKTAKRSGARQASRAGHKDASPALSLDGLERLGSAMWRACVGWLLEQQGYTLNSATSDALSACWRGVDADGKELFIQALRNAPSHAISERDVAETARLAHEQRLERALLLAAGSPTRAAHALAEASNVRILDGETLRSQLATIAEGVNHQQTNGQAEAKARARAAIGAHVAMQKTLTAAAKRLESKSAKPRTPTSPTVAKARDHLRAARIAADQAFLAWETLLADWLESFGSAPAHDGTLPLLGDASEFAALRERGTHLGSALADLLRDLARTPSDGEMGYSAWRSSVIEEARLRCAALIARLKTVDPAQWADFDAARPPAHETDALEAEIAARRASARADKAQSQVTRLAG
ncbi:MAG TPA: restriction endonuclease [Ktedonobacterales bacterium]